MSAPTCTAEIADEIISRVCAGAFVQDACKELGTSVTAFWRFRNTSEDHRKAYAHARELQAAEIARQAYQRGWDATDAALGRLAFDAGKWMAAKLDPANYGDKLQHANAAGDGDQVTKVEYSWTPAPEAAS